MLDCLSSLREFCGATIEDPGSQICQQCMMFLGKTTAKKPVGVQGPSQYTKTLKLRVGL